MLPKAPCHERNKFPANPETSIKDEHDQQTFELRESVKYSKWERAQVENKEKVKIAENVLPKEDFLALIKKSPEDFKKHTQRVKTVQRTLKVQTKSS